MNRRSLITAGTATVLSSRMAAPSEAQSNPVIRIGYSVNDSGLGPVYAYETGLFQKAGLNVELLPLQNGSVIGAAITGGSAEVGLMDTINVANASLHGLPLSVFAGNVLFSKAEPTLVLITGKTSAYRTAKDLENTNVGVVSVKSLSSSSVLEWLRVNGTDPAKVKLFELTFPEMNTALARGSISAALQGEPFLSAGKADMRVLGVPFEAVGTAFYINIYAASRPWLSANAATAKKIASVLYDAGRWANTHRAESAAIESRYLKLPLDVTRNMAHSVFATSFDPALISPVLDLGARYQLTPRPVQASEITAVI